jgi:hypothetical protein
MTLEETIESRFTSLNDVPVRDIRLTREEWLELKARLKPETKEVKK